ncbi:MAG: hypothetical protein IAE85_11270 [Anaerolinea sp.]|nr:hypothetical protein [Anaerolinea sp.]
MTFNVVVIGGGIVGLAAAVTCRMIHVLNAPSPAATASLSIGQAIAGKVARR